MGESRTKKRISRFIELFGKKLDWKSASGYFPERRIFYDNEEPNNKKKKNVVEEKIIDAFCDIVVPRLPGLLQFWSLRESEDGRRFLSCCDQPFAVEDLDARHQFYRLCCIKFGCNINIDGEKRFTPDDDVKELMMMIENSPVVTAFVNRFPDVVFDLRSLQGKNAPLVEAALMSGFTSLILLPVFDDNSSCVGVVEFAMKVSNLFMVMKELTSALERAGLKTYHVQDSIPFETTPGLKLATSEIEVALKTLCESHHLSLAQVWIANESEKHASPKKLAAVKLCGYCSDSLDDDDDPDIKLYYETCNVLPLKMREVSIVGKTLETSQPHCCKNLNKLLVNGPLGFLLGLCRCSCLAICLRSPHTGENVDYVFEFLWPRGRNYSIVLQSLLSNLKRCLPSFKLASSGQELGGELRVVVFQKSILKKLEQGKVKEEEEEDDHKGQGPNSSLKRKVTTADDLSEGPYILYSDPFWIADDDMLLPTSYKNKSETVTIIRSAYILEDAMEKIEEAFMLDPETYTLEYQAEGNWFKLEADLHLAGLRQCYRKDPKSCRLKVVCVAPETNGLAADQQPPDVKPSLPKTPPVKGSGDDDASAAFSFQSGGVINGMQDSLKKPTTTTTSSYPNPPVPKQQQFVTAHTQPCIQFHQSNFSIPHPPMHCNPPPQQQGIIPHHLHPSQGLPFSSHPIGNMGIGMMGFGPPQFQQQQPIGAGRRRVKITHPETHEELRFD